MAGFNKESGDILTVNMGGKNGFTKRKRVLGRENRLLGS